VSNIEEQTMLDHLREQGVIDKALEGLGMGAPAPVEETDTAVDEVDEAEEQEGSAEEDIPTDVGTEEKAEEEEQFIPPSDDIFLDMTPEVEQFLAKYDNDLNKALKAATEGQSLIGRQGSELGDLRRELQEIRQAIQDRPAPLQPYQQFPDEMDSPEEAVPVLRNIAEAAFANDDGATFERALQAWQEQDPLGVETYKMMKATQVMTMQAQAQPAPQTQAEDLMRQVVEKNPQVNDPAFQQQLETEIAKLPSLGRVIRGEIPGVTPEERVVAFEELVSRVAARQDADTQQEARRRVAIRTSDEARKARLEAQVASGGRTAPAPVEEEARAIRLGDTALAVSEQETQQMLEAVFGSHASVSDASKK
jgi:hypothetical protein